MNFKELLTEEELVFIKDRYPEVDINGFDIAARGLSVVTNLDILESSIKYDIAEKDFSDGKYKGCIDEKEALYMCLGIKKKIQQYNKKRDRTHVEGFDIDALCDEANMMSKRAMGSGIGYDFSRIDTTIFNILRILPYDENPEETINHSALCLGAKFGELMLNGYFLKEGYDWALTDGYNHPVMSNPDTGVIIDPIGHILSFFTERNRLHMLCFHFFMAMKNAPVEVLLDKRSRKDGDLIIAHFYCSNNKPELEKGEKCGCFFCGRIFNSLEIKDWEINEESTIDKDGTAFCPYCGIDSIIGESSGFPITEEFLERMNKFWF